MRAGETAATQDPLRPVGPAFCVEGVEAPTVGLGGGRCALLAHRLTVVQRDNGAVHGTVVAHEKGDDLGLGHGGTSDLGPVQAVNGSFRPFRCHWMAWRLLIAKLMPCMTSN